MRALSAVFAFISCVWGTTQLHAGPIAAFLKKPAGWFHSDEGKRVAENVLSWQSPAGSWPKNTNTAEIRFSGDSQKLRGTFDNRATLDELRFLARAFASVEDRRFKAAFERGFDHVLKAQYPNGGWPQTYPPGNAYARHITFNDDSMVRLMEFVREVSASTQYAFLDAGRRNAARDAFDRGVECILKCQIRVDGKLTAWCAQHDEVDFTPRPARTYELASLSGAESAGIVRLLMSIERPKREIVDAVEAAAAWFEKVKLTGIRVDRVPDANAPKGFDKRLIDDPAAPPLWARFYDLRTSKPLFVDRDGVPKARLSEIGYERRNGYAWLGDWPSSLLASDYPAWKSRLK